MRLVFVTLTMLLAISCTPAPEAYVFRNSERPEYTRTTTVDGLKAMNPAAVTLLDVRLNEDFAASPTMIPGAVHRDPEAIAQWASQIPKNKPVVVYCVKGKWVSQKAATYLSKHGFDVRSLDGGIDAWTRTSEAK